MSAARRSQDRFDDAAARAARWSAERDRHDSEVQGWRFLPSLGRRRMVTKVTAPLRFWTVVPAGPLVRGVAVLVIVVWWAVMAVTTSVEEAWRDILTPAVIALIIVLAATQRLSVSQHGMSFDLGAINRVSLTGFVPLFGVVDAVAGPRPADWPRGRRRGCWIPGWTQVHVYYRDETNTERVTSTWVLYPDPLVEALTGRPSGRSTDA